MDRILIDMLPSGALGVYAVPLDTPYFIPYETGEEWQNAVCRPGRLIVPHHITSNLYCMLHPLANMLARFDDLPGSLIVSLRSVAKMESGLWTRSTLQLEGEPDLCGPAGCSTVFVLGGLAFVPDLEFGECLDGSDPTYLIQQACLGLCGEPFDNTHPAIRDCLEKADRICQRDNILYEEGRRKNKQAEVKALRILCECLSSEQKAEFDAQGHFHVQSPDGFRYIILKKPMHNVFRVEGNKRIIEYCLVSAPQYQIPVCDLMLMQKLLLETDPNSFHQNTNAWTLLDNGEKVFHSGEGVQFSQAALWEALATDAWEERREERARETPTTDAIVAGLDGLRCTVLA